MGRYCTAGHPGVAGVQGRVPPAAGGLPRVVGPEALPAGGRPDRRPIDIEPATSSKARTLSVAGITYREVMTTLLIFFAGIVAAIATVVGCVAWRDRRGRGSFVDPSISRAALVQADRQAVQGLLAAAELPVTDFLGRRSVSHSRTNRT
jgi:hypothetical protein